MNIIILILITMLSILSLILIKIIRDLKLINKQTAIKLTTNANFTIVNDLKIRELNELCDNLNLMYQKFAIAQVEQITKEKEFKEMLSNIAHDVRTPLTSVQGYLQILRESSINDENVVYYQIINKRLSDIKRLLEQFFMYSKLSNDDFKLDDVTCNLYTVCCTSISSFYQAFADKNCEPIIDFADKNIHLPIHKDLLLRMFDNLIQNALIHGKGDITMYQRGNKLFVSNTIESTCTIDVRKVFDRFYKSDNSRTHISSGLGLSIVQKMAHLMHAHVEATISNQQFYIIITFHHMNEKNQTS